MLKRLAIIFFIFLLIPIMILAQTDTDPAQPGSGSPITPIAPGDGRSVDYDDVAGTATAGDDVDLPPQWVSGDTFALVSVNRANLRTQPSITEGVVVDIAIYGERFLIVGIFFPGESTVREPESEDFVFDDPNEREVWYLVEVNGGAAWIFGGLVIVANPETLDALENQNLTPEQQAYIDSQVAFNANTVSTRYASRIRSAPSSSSTQVGIIPFGSRVFIIGRNQFSTWFFVDYNGTQGWVAGFLLAFPPGYDANAVAIVQ